MRADDGGPPRGRRRRGRVEQRRAAGAVGAARRSAPRSARCRAAPAARPRRRVSSWRSRSGVGRSKATTTAAAGASPVTTPTRGIAERQRAARCRRGARGPPSTPPATRDPAARPGRPGPPPGAPRPPRPSAPVPPAPGARSRRRRAHRERPPRVALDQVGGALRRRGDDDALGLLAQVLHERGEALAVLPALRPGQQHAATDSGPERRPPLEGERRLGRGDEQVHLAGLEPACGPARSRGRPGSGAPRRRAPPPATPHSASWASAASRRPRPALAQAAQHPGERGDGVRPGQGARPGPGCAPARPSAPPRASAAVVGGPAQPLEGAGDGRGEMKIFE